jgi:hypothetical protein
VLQIIREFQNLLEFFAREGTFALPVFLSAQERHHEALSMRADGPQAVSV